MQALAACIATLAGFLATNGFFVSFMSGNSTRMGIGLEQGVASGLIAGALGVAATRLEVC